MARPYNKKTKADAALLLDICASSLEQFPLIGAKARELGIPDGSTPHRLACAAYYEVTTVAPVDYEAKERFAEAAQIVREGWRIGDPISSIATEEMVTDTFKMSDTIALTVEGDEPPEGAFVQRVEHEIPSGASVDWNNLLVPPRINVADLAASGPLPYGGAPVEQRSEDALDTDTVSIDVVTAAEDVGDSNDAAPACTGFTWDEGVK